MLNIYKIHDDDDDEKTFVRDYEIETPKPKTTIKEIDIDKMHYRVNVRKLCELLVDKGIITKNELTSVISKVWEPITKEERDEVSRDWKIY